MKKLSLHLLLAFSLLLAACGDGDGDGDGDDASDDTTEASDDSGTAEGDELTVAVGDLSGTGQDVMTAQTAGYLHWWLEVYDWLLELDENGEVVGGLAEDWYASDDGLQWTFEIREGVLFHDGTELTAEDVAFTIERLIFDEESVHDLIGYAEIIESIEATDDYTVVITSNQPDASIPTNYLKIIGQGAIMSKDYYEEVGREEANRNPIGTGPYEFVSNEGEQSVTLQAFTDPERSDWQKEREPEFETLTMLGVPDISTRVSLLNAGDADIIPIPQSAVSELNDNAQLVEIPNATNSVMRCLGYTLNPESPCDDVRVREALNIAIDRQTIADSVYGGFAKPSPGFFGAPDSIGFPEDLEAHPYDPERAQELLAEAGYDESNPLTVEIIAHQNDADFFDQPLLAETVAGYLNDIGVEATLQVTDWDNQEEAFEQGEYPGMRNTDAVEPVTLFMRGMDNRIVMLGEELAEYGDRGPAGEASFDFDHPEAAQMLDYLNEAALATDPAETANQIGEFHRYKAEHFVDMPLLVGDAVFALSDRVSPDGWQPTPARSYPSNLWTLPPAS